jgi:hypothetical protein
VFATFDPIPNPTTEDPPFMKPVPAGIVFSGNKFYIGLFFGFPFLCAAARLLNETRRFRYSGSPFVLR